MTDVDVLVVGAGPAGLAAAQEAVGNGAGVLVLERLDRVGGLARTIDFEGNRFDIGPHRFYTKNDEIRDFYRSSLGDQLVRVQRLTRILYNDLYFHYPLTPVNAMLGVGMGAGIGIAGSYATARARSRLAPKPIESFEDWIVDRFGRRLYETFFKVYTEKVWGIPCHRISADWAAQRIRGLSLGSAIRNALFPSSHSKPRTLTTEFLYPREGAGQVYENISTFVGRSGGRVVTGAAVRRLRRDGMVVREAVVDDGSGGSDTVSAKWFLISAPLTDLIEMTDPAPPPEVVRAARALRYRDHIGVNLVVEGSPFSDQWIYVHSKDVSFARIANYRNFSPAMAESSSVSPLTVEYFSSPGDELARLSDDELIARAIRELRHVRMLAPDQVKAGFVVRSPQSYPLFEIGHESHMETIRSWLHGLKNLLPIGRSGMFKYNNQDHAIATGLSAARTALGLERHDPWEVNIDAVYHEEDR